MDSNTLLKRLDRTLETRNLYPEERERLLKLRDGLVRKQRLEILKMFRKSFRRSLEEQTPGPLLGEQQTGAPRNIPGAEGSGVVISPEETPGTYIRDFVPNRARTRDRIIILPELLRRKGWDI